MMHLATVASGALAPREYTPAAPLFVFLSARYEGQGWACLGYIHGDPSIKKGTPGYSPMHQEWFAWPREANAMAARYIELAERGLNLYLAQCLFTQRRRSYKTALPSRWLCGDDAPLDAKCTELVQSLEGSLQAWLKLDTALPAKERGELQRRWRVLLNGDFCSANALGMVRAPIGFNTKRHGRFPVRIVGGTGNRYSLTSVDAKLPQVKRRACRGRQRLGRLVEPAQRRRARQECPL